MVSCDIDRFCCICVLTPGILENSREYLYTTCTERTMQLSMNSDDILNKLSTHLKNTIAKAISFAAHLGDEEVSPLHILFALAEEEGSIGREILQKAGLTSEHIFHWLKGKKSYPKKSETPGKANTKMLELPELDPTSKKILEKAMYISYEHRHSYVGTEHLLAALIESDIHALKLFFTSQKINHEALEDHLATILDNTSNFPHVDDVVESITHMQHTLDQDVHDDHPLPQEPPQQSSDAPLHIGRKKMNKKASRRSPTALDVFTVDLTQKKNQTLIDTVVGREEEIDRLIHILCRRKKNNPVLVGEPGVGKTAIVEGLAKRISEGDVPDILKRKKILSLDLTLLIAGTVYRGEFEGRIKQLIDELAERPDSILFIDEIHNIIGAGSNQGTMDAANILKPALARGQLRCIGATTIDEYKKYISSDPALERRLQPIDIDEPTAEQTIQMLDGIKASYEAYHGFSIPREAIETAVRLSDKMIHDNFFPDKAIDIIDEAAAAVRTKKRANKQEQHIRNLERMVEQWEDQKEEAIQKEEFDAAIQIKETIAETRKEIASLIKKQAKQKQRKLPVGKEDVAEVVAKRFHVDAAMLLSEEREHLERTKKNLREHIVGQDAAIDQIIQTLQKTYLKLPASKRPAASLFFVGPSGVGKTELAKRLAKELTFDDRALIRLDMSEFSEGHGTSKLLGSPAGYVGYKERNLFLEQLKKRPHSVVLFDEIDKAHRDVRKLLLQILDEGELTDSNGKKTSFRHAIVILTSNIGAELYASPGIGFGAKDSPAVNGIPDDRKKALLQKLTEEFGAEWIGRIDNVCLFSPLQNEHLTRIIEKQIQKISGHLTETKQIAVTIDESAIAAIARQGHTTEVGARHIGQAVEQAIHEAAWSLFQKQKRKQHYTLKYAEGLYHL